MLQLTRPIAFMDLETTGVDLCNDRIVEIAIVKLLPDGSRQTKRKILNPQIPIPAEVSAIHGITDEMVKDAPTFKEVANEIKQFLDGSDLGGYNSNRFDIPVLMEERTLTAAYKFFCDKELVDAHSAEADVLATIEVFENQVKKYDTLGTTIESILDCIGEDKIVDYARRFSFNEKDEEVFNFGKYKGKSVYQTLCSEPQYYDWMMRSDFPLHTKKKLTEINNRRLLAKK